MADNTVLSAHTTTGDTLRDIDRTGVKTPVVGIDLNIGGGSETLMVGAMPVTGTFWQATQPVSGTFWQATQPISGTVDVSGSVAVTGTFWQATQPVSGTLAVTQSGTWSDTVTQATAASLNATVVGTGTFAVQVSAAIPAGTNLLGQVSASDETATIYNGTTACTPKFAAITASTSGATTVVALVGGKRIRVIRWSLSSNGSVNIKWQSHVTPTDLTGLHYLVQFASAGGAYCPQGIFQTISGEALDINLSASVAVGGELTYIEV